jgi:hypothetical protein
VLKRQYVPAQPMLDSGEGVFVAEKARAQRFQLQIAVRYRANGESRWHRGVTRNVSCSGVLFNSDDPAAPSTPMEINLVLPKEFTGRWAAEVVCRGTVMRSEQRGREGEGALIATKISHYRLVRS